VVAQGSVNPAATPDLIAALMATVATLAKQSEIAAAREARLARTEEEEEARKQARKEQYERNRSGENTGVIERQSKCLHLKGGKFRNRNGVKDFAVYFHRFIDNTQYVKCFLCKMKWYQTDTAEVIIRGGTARKNHTGIGWREAVLMLRDSTNQPSSSEMAPEFAGVTQKAEDIPDTIGVITR